MEIETTKTRIVLPDGVEESEFRTMVVERTDELIEKLCNEVCRWPHTYKRSEYGRMKREHCDHCPVSKFEEE